MLPKNSKHFIKPTADSLEKDVELVEDLLTFYFQELRKSLVNFKHYNIKVEGLGTFKVKKKELSKLYMKHTNHLNVLKEPRTFREMSIKKDTEEKLEKVTSLQDLLNEERKRKAIFMKKKNGKVD